ncbi:hypothetical protein RPMA_19270 [Tardiphaga alba]|uniref:Uncharacterized protein n=1 Tax=Tardiphaga alba TaxID=340268 RepID=A0ABX8AEC2_9BRAD|nr:hypothetical protein [Tardiphaga alba]QUS40735.1 hypothetical protein RPMA_19270 [Tardiphaga alba]
MPLQNRVTPFGDIVAVPDRGLFTGNRGIIHDPATKTLLNRRWSNPAWITCVCEFRGRRRDVMARQSWTELFFLDEATSFAAGHRPCFYCRRDDANRFRAAWEQGNGVSGVKATEIDRVLHAERLERRGKRMHSLEGPVDALPDGAMVEADSDSYLIAQGRVWRWSFAGYAEINDSLHDAQLLTPPSTLRAFRAGYRPVLHSTASKKTPPSS